MKTRQPKSAPCKFDAFWSHANGNIIFFHLLIKPNREMTFKKFSYQFHSLNITFEKCAKVRNASEIISPFSIGILAENQ